MLDSFQAVVEWCCHVFSIASMLRKVLKPRLVLIALLRTMSESFSLPDTALLAMNRFQANHAHRHFTIPYMHQKPLPI